MIFPDKLDVLTIHARLIAETVAHKVSEMKPYSNQLSPLLRIATTMKPPML